MRIDQFLNAINVVKSRKIAQDMIDSKVIVVNGIVAKNSRKVQVGDRIDITYLEHTKHYEIIELPTTKHTRKRDQLLFIKDLNAS